MAPAMTMAQGTSRRPPRRPTVDAEATGVPSPVDLSATLSAAGGTLWIADPDPVTRGLWRRAIQDAIRSGQRLHYTGRLRGDVMITLPDATSPAAQSGRAPAPGAPNRGIKPSARARTHPLVEDLRRRAARSDPQHPDLLLPRVPTALLPRALSLLDRLFRQAEARGYGVQDPLPDRGSRPPVFRITVRGIEHPLTLREYNGTLILKLKNAWSGRRSWTDGAQTRLEGKTSDVLAELEARTRIHERRRTEHEREHHDAQREQQAHTDRARARFAEDHATRALRDQVASWQLARDLRALCDEVRRLHTEGHAPAGSHTWLAWASAHADRLDPTQHPLAIPASPEPTPEDLDPYLERELDLDELEEPAR